MFSTITLDHFSNEFAKYLFLAVVALEVRSALDRLHFLIDVVVALEVSLRLLHFGRVVLLASCLEVVLEKDEEVWLDPMDSSD
jgi:hypothetical protein